MVLSAWPSLSSASASLSRTARFAGIRVEHLAQAVRVRAVAILAVEARRARKEHSGVG